MIYAISALFVLWIVLAIYIVKHVRAIQNELIALDKEQHQQNMDIIHLLKMDVEISNAIQNQASAIKKLYDLMDIVFEDAQLQKKVQLKSTSDIFNSPKGEA